MTPDQMVIPASNQQLILLQCLSIIGTSAMDAAVRKMAVRVLCSVIERVGRASSLRRKLAAADQLETSSGGQTDETSKAKIEEEWSECHQLMKWLMYSMMTSLRNFLKANDPQISRSAIEALSHVVRVLGPVKEYLPSPTVPMSFFDLPSEHPRLEIDRQLIDSRFHFDLLSQIRFASNEDGTFAPLF